MNEIKKACELLSNADIVAIPTETVYGLAADATLDQGIAKIFAVKKRPTFNPLILHVDQAETGFQWGKFSLQAQKLANAFWKPGELQHRPLTLIVSLPEDSSISKLVTAGLRTVGIRVPNHPITTELLRRYPRPLAAPSANASTKISATTAEIVQQSLGDAVPFILDGGPCVVGVESTIVDTTTNPVQILRYGGTTIEELTGVLGYEPQHASHGPIRAPGMMKKHYSPSLPLYLDCTTSAPNAAFLGFGKITFGPWNLSPKGNVVEAAANLFRMLFEADQPQKFDSIRVAPIPNTGLGRAIRDRLERAAARD